MVHVSRAREAPNKVCDLKRDFGSYVRVLQGICAPGGPTLWAILEVRRRLYQIGPSPPLRRLSACDLRNK